MLARVINPDSAVPPYEQVAKMMRDEIAEGNMTGRIPSVHTIAEHHHVSHRVAARALEILKGEGMVVDVPARATSSAIPAEFELTSAKTARTGVQVCRYQPAR